MAKALWYNGDIADAHVGEILHEIYVEHFYAQFLQGREGLTILDLGANIGLTAQYFSNFGTVYAVEPSSEHMKCLVSNTSGLNVRAIRGAVSAVSKVANLHLYPNVTAYSLAGDMLADDPDLQVIDTEEVPCFGMYDLLENLGIDTVDFLKMDIEGAEYEVVHSEQFARCCHRFKMMVGELHGWGTQGYAPHAEIVNELGERLRSLGFMAGFKSPSEDSPVTLFVAQRVK